MTMQRRGFFAALVALFAAPKVFYDIGRNEVISTADLDWSTRVIEIPIDLTYAPGSALIPDDGIVRPVYDSWYDATYDDE